MQKLEMFAIYDKAVGSYMRPFFHMTKGSCLRQLMDDLKDPNSPVAAHPEDYTVFHLGTWNDENADLEKVDPTVVARCHELMQTTEE